jgi:hypothetical protein
MKGRQFVRASTLTAAAARLDSCRLSLRSSISSAVAAAEEDAAQAAAEKLAAAMVIAAD